MKKYLLLLLLIFCGIVISTAQTQYEVIASSSLNVRNYASKDGYGLGKLHRGEKVDVYAINNGWAQIHYNNRTAYVVLLTQIWGIIQQSNLDDKAAEIVEKVIASNM